MEPLQRETGQDDKINRMHRISKGSPLFHPVNPADPVEAFSSSA
jgi:hypothetical protein